MHLGPRGEAPARKSPSTQHPTRASARILPKRRYGRLLWTSSAPKTSRRSLLAGETGLGAAFGAIGRFRLVITKALRPGRQASIGGIELEFGALAAGLSDGKVPIPVQPLGQRLLFGHRWTVRR
jgi:hypothetical protein